ncbi:uncharacterized protein G2W53_018049 [Senna tora]|uniref:Uncharacterized protein n=1 Tax=Senna tora TaxID=362788 RepID=A0A834TV57_9FABA|nr:uncharacterized protein G2W53_018049 [Senna tora]
MSVYNPSVVVCAFSVLGYASVGIYLKDGEFDSKETLIPLPPLPLDVAYRFSTLTGVVNGILCIDFATSVGTEIYALYNITNSSVHMVQSIQPTSDNGFGGNSITGHECIVRMWKDDLHGIPSSIRTWLSYDVSINIVGDQFFLKEVDGALGIITWTFGRLEITRDYNLYMKRNASNGSAIFRRVKRVKDVPVWMKFLTYRNDKFVFHCDDHFQVDVNKAFITWTSSTSQNVAYVIW